MRIKQLVFGLATWVPGFFSILARPTGGSSSVRYCYSVWLRHLVFARKHGLPRLPRVIAELGPGDSLGVGLAALVSGAEKYYALDVFRYANEAHLNSMIDELATLFLARTPIPGEDEFPRLYPKLETYDFPSWLFDDVHLHDALAPERIAYLHETLSNSQRRQQIIEYAVPWYAHDVVQKGEIDFIFFRQQAAPCRLKIWDLPSLAAKPHALPFQGISAPAISKRCAQNRHSAPWSG